MWEVLIPLAVFAAGIGAYYILTPEAGAKSLSEPIEPPIEALSEEEFNDPPIMLKSMAVASKRGTPSLGHGGLILYQKSTGGGGPCAPAIVNLEGIQIASIVSPCGSVTDLTCDTLTNAVLVEGAGSDVNGLYTLGVGLIADKLWWENTVTGTLIRWGGSTWQILNSDLTERYYIDDAAEWPWLGAWVVSIDGVEPVPTVTQATIGDICECDGCTSVLVTINGNEPVLFSALTGCPLELSFAAEYENGSAIGAWDGTTYVIPNPITGITKTVRQYTAGDTWVKPSNLMYLEVLAVGGGAGGGSGSKQAAGVASRAGGGGAAGAIVRVCFAGADVTGPQTITIGAGGAGGAAVTTNDTVGNVGANGGDTSFGALAVAHGGHAGASYFSGGVISDKSADTPAFGSLNIQGGAGAISSATGLGGGNGTVAATTLALLYFGAPSAGGVSAANAGGNGGSASRLFDDTDTLCAAIAGGTAQGGAGTAGADNVFTKLSTSSTAITIGLGQSGSAGAGSNDNTINGGAGGNGGLYGGGGAGGGACRNDGTAVSGAGGNGGQGFLVLIEHTLS